ncbi:MAG: SMC family ATPase [Deinococcaceae bacterium]
MRPLKLSLSNFTCFRSEVELDFATLDLFAIEGQTGSGKSSILDAICFALFGQTPRLGGKGLDALISTGEPRLTVALEFEMGREMYRVVRTRGRKSGQNEVRFNRLSGGLAAFDKKKDLQEAIDAVLGLGFDSFRRAILLPQGEFDGFLKGTGKQRQELLGSLIGLEHYQNLHRWSGVRAREYEMERKMLLDRLATEYSGVDMDAKAALEQQQQEISQAIGASEASERDLESQQIRLQALCEWTQQHLKVQSEWNILDQQKSKFEGIERELQRARQIEHLRPALARLLEDEAEFKVCETARQDAQGAYRQAKIQRENCELEDRACRLEAEQLDLWRERYLQLEQAQRSEQRLKSLGGRLDSDEEPLMWSEESFEKMREQGLERDRWEREVRELEHRMRALEQLGVSIQTQTDQSLKLQRESQALEVKIVDLQGIQLEIQARVDRLQALRPRVVWMAKLGLSSELKHPKPLDWDEALYLEVQECVRKKRDLDAKWEHHRQDLAQFQKKASMVESLEAELSRLRTQADVALLDWQTKLREERVERQRLDFVRQRQQAHLLRSNLVVGQPCLVCQQTVKTVVATQSVVLDESRLSVLERERQQLESAHRGLEQDIVRLETRLSSENHMLSEGRNALERRALELEEFGASLRPEVLENRERLEAGLVLDIVSVTQGHPLEGLEQTEKTRQADHRNILGESLKRLDELNREQARIEGQLEANKRQWSVESQQVREAQLRLDREGQVWSDFDPRVEMRRLLAGLALEIRSVVGDSGVSIAELRDTLKADIARVEDKVKSIQDKTLKATQHFERASMSLDHAEKQCQNIEMQYRTRRNDLEGALDALSLTLDGLRSYIQNRGDLDQLESAWLDWKQNAAEVSAKRQAIEHQLDGQTYNADEHKQVETRLLETRNAHKRLLSQQGVLAERLRRLETDLSSLRDIERQLGDLAKRYDTYATLAAALKSDGFPKYLLEEIERELLLSASELLREISDGRYQLVLAEGEYRVTDRWNGGEQRAVRTLSGGETFLASLSLAIALSDHLAGNARLGSLFLDEGFGTLDPQSLESVASALERLQLGGRMVGVITHVASLAERLPARIQVHKNTQGSHVTVDQ